MPTATDLDRFARLLEGAPDASASATTSERQLASLATTLESARAPEADPDFKVALRAQLIAAAREQAAPGLLARMRESFDHVTARWRYSARVAGATGAVALALSSGGVAAAAEQALPGDALYSVKLTLEDVRLALTPGDMARAQRRLSYAADRVAEARAAAAEGNMEGAALALEEADELAREGAEAIIARPDPAAVLALEAFTVRQRQALDDLLPLLAGPAAAAASDALSGLAHIESLLPTRPAPFPTGQPTAGATPPGVAPSPTPPGTGPTPTVPPPSPGPTVSAAPAPTEIPTEIPTELPTGTPTALPTDVPTDLPTLPVDVPPLPDDVVSSLPDPGTVVDDVIDTATGAVEDTIDDVTDPADDTTDAVVDAITGAVDTLLGGL